MNKNIKTLINVLPIILVPLLTERDRIKEHPEIEKLGRFSNTAYHNVKDKSEGAYQSVKDTGSTIYQTGKSAAGTVGSKISDKKHERAYHKDIKSYQRSIKKEDKLLAQFEKDKEKHRRKRMQQDLSKDTVVPKIMQSSQGMSHEDKIAGMSVSSELITQSSNIDPQTEAALDTNRENQDIGKLYEEDQSMSRASLTEKDEARSNIANQENQNVNNGRIENDETDQSIYEENYMTTDVQQLYFDKVKNHEKNIEGYDSSELFKRHHEKLDSTVNYDKTDSEVKKGPVISGDSLFGQHRAAAEDHITQHGQKTGIESNMSKSKKQQKLEQKIRKKRKKF